MGNVGEREVEKWHGKRRKKEEKKRLKLRVIFVMKQNEVESGELGSWLAMKKAFTCNIK